MSWFSKTSALVAVIDTNPTESKSGTCALCDSFEGRPVSEVGEPEFHPNCKCTIKFVEREDTKEEGDVGILPDVGDEEEELSLEDLLDDL